jgi:hypothetical protein
MEGVHLRLTDGALGAEVGRVENDERAVRQQRRMDETVARMERSRRLLHSRAGTARGGTPALTLYGVLRDGLHSRAGTGRA